jgi:hypothetical protein
MSATSNWRDVKAKARAADPAWDSDERISQIKSGTATSLESLRAYVIGLGGHLEIVARIGNIQLNVA